MMNECSHTLQRQWPTMATRWRYNTGLMKTGTIRYYKWDNTVWEDRLLSFCMFELMSIFRFHDETPWSYMMLTLSQFVLWASLRCNTCKMKPRKQHVLLLWILLSSTVIKETEPFSSFKFPNIKETWNSIWGESCNSYWISFNQTGNTPSKQLVKSKQ